MKIIKLIGDNKYQIEQTLQTYNSIIYKIIYIKENIFKLIIFNSLIYIKNDNSR